MYFAQVELSFLLNGDIDKREGGQGKNSLFVNSGALSSVYMPGIKDQPETQFAMNLPRISTNMTLASVAEMKEQG